MPLGQRFLRSPWTWASLAIAIGCTFSIVHLIQDVMKDRKAEDDSRIPGLNADALWMCAGLALPTMIFWIVCFILIDRYKPQRLLVWAIALIWGGTFAVNASYVLNSWASDQMAVIDQTSGVSAIRVAVFVAPFIEEATKASVIFLIVVLDRNRFTSRVSGAIVGGLAGAGFAFVENIIYYARVVVYGSYTGSAGDVKQALDYLVYMRGVVTCFGHPLFTMMTGVGVAFAVTSRSKIVRVISPAAGFLMAAFLHMFFNFQASMIPAEQLKLYAFFMAWPVVIGVIIRVISSSIRQGRTVSARLTEYVSVGWLPNNYPAAFSKLRTRAWTVIMSIWHGSPIKTWLLQKRATDLAMLSEEISRGTVDEGGLWREFELVNEIRDLEEKRGLVDGKGLRPYWPWNARKRKGISGFPPPSEFLPGGATMGAPLKYSAVDPRWKPPV